MTIEFVKEGRQTSEVLDRLRSEKDAEAWEQLTNERASRRGLLMTKGMAETLVDAAILGIILARIAILVIIAWYYGF
jgi:hypothetical protein